MWVILSSVAFIMLGIFYFQADIHIVAVCLPTKKITAGEDLSKYECRKVSCTFRYVAQHVVSFYDEDDPSETLYTCGYIALDDGLQNPFCVFLPIGEAKRMDAMVDKTWNVMNGGKEQIPSVEVNGYVWKLSSKNVAYYHKALKKIYGESAPLADEVYYIDDQASVKGENEAVSIRIVAFSLCMMLLGFFGYLALVTFRAFQVPGVIEEFLTQNKMSRLELEREFLSAKEIDGVIWLTPDLTIYLNNTCVGIVKNRDIVWAYIQRVHKGKSTFHELRLFSVDQKLCAKVITGLNRQEILEFYKVNCPHIVIGRDRTKKRLFKHDFDGFLQLQYHRYINRQNDAYDAFGQYPKQPGGRISRSAV